LYAVSKWGKLKFRFKRLDWRKPHVRNFIVFFGLLTLFLPLSNRSIDYHHQGLIFSTALGVSKGLVLYRDIWSQYGPIPTYIQAVFLLVFGSKLLYLQILSVLISACSGTLAFSIFSKIYGVGSAATAVSIWALSAPFMLWPLHPWPTDFALLFFLIAIYLVCQEEKYSHNFLFLVSGFFVGISFWSRINTGVCIFVSTFLAIGLSLSWRRAQIFLYGFFTCITIGACLLALSNSLTSFFQQAIVWPLVWVGEIKTGLESTDLVAYGLMVPSIFGALFILSAVLINRLRGWFLLAGIGFLVPGFIVTQYISNRLQTNEVFWTPINPNWSFPGLTPITALWGFSLIALTRAWITFCSSRSFRFEWLKNRNQYDFFLLIASVGFLAGIYPQPDIYHLWWVVLPSLGPTVGLISSHIPQKVSRISLAFAAIIALLVPAISAVVQNYERENLVKWGSGSPLSGMLEDRESFNIHEQQFELIKYLQSTKGPLPVLNLCIDGFYFSLGEKTVLPDPYFFFWGPGANGAFLPDSSITDLRISWIHEHKPILYICNPAIDVPALMKALNYNVVRQDPNMVYGGNVSIAISNE